jgi:hypothetical protein
MKQRNEVEIHIIFLLNKLQFFQLIFSSNHSLIIVFVKYLLIFRTMENYYEDDWRKDGCRIITSRRG